MFKRKHKKILKYQNIYISKYRDGFTLLETLVAVSILVTALVGSLSLAAQSIRAATTAKNQIIAFNLAQEAIELVRYQRDLNAENGADWLSGLENCDEDYNAAGCIIYIDWALPANVITEPCSNPNACDYIKYNSANSRFDYVETSETKDTQFRRRVLLTHPSSYEVKVEAQIQWKGGVQDNVLTLENHLFDWK